MTTCLLPRVLHFMECLIDVHEVVLLWGVMTQCRDSGHKTLTRGWSCHVFTDGNIIHTSGSIDIKVPRRKLNIISGM